MTEHDTQYGTFDFGLTSEQEDRARRLHRDSLVVDLAFQGPISPDAWTDVLHKELDEAMAARPDDVWVPFEFLQDGTEARGRKWEFRGARTTIAQRQGNEDRDCHGAGRRAPE